jgi:hypothetical protein
VHDGNPDQAGGEQRHVDHREAVSGDGHPRAAEAVHHQREELGCDQRRRGSLQRRRQVEHREDQEAAEQTPDGGGGDHFHRENLAGKLHLWPVVVASELAQSWQIMPTCSHDGFHSGEGRYEPKTAILRYVVICETCRQEIREVSVQRYTPEYIADANAPSIAA